LREAKEEGGLSRFAPNLLNISRRIMKSFSAHAVRDKVSSEDG